MGFSDSVLYHLARRWPSPVANQVKRLNADPGTEAYAMAYARHQQFGRKVKRGVQVDVMGLDVLEIGCGHGGISCFLACVGARSVVGIDINAKNLAYAETFAQDVAARFGVGYCLPVKFMEMAADQMAFADASFDIVYADNVFEHFIAPDAVIKETYRVLRSGGMLVVPVFSSIFSKYGLHLKHGLKLPWANLFFSEKTIIRAMYRLAKDNPQILELYPGLSGEPERVRDLRPCKDLNDITYAEFEEMAHRIGFTIERFEPVSTRMGRIVSKIPILRNSLLRDIFSIGASARLRKEG